MRRGSLHPLLVALGLVTVLSLFGILLRLNGPNAESVPTPRSSDAGVGAGKVQADFNGDGYADLMVAGTEYDKQDDPRYGSVAVLYGSAQGMATANQQRIDGPDLPGYPMTFCVDEAHLPPGTGSWPDGLCFARCDPAYYPAPGCRPGYECVELPRANETHETRLTCVPSTGP